MDKNTHNPLIGLLIRFGFLGVFILVVIIVSGISRCSYNHQSAVEFTSSLEKGKKAYVDIVAIEPRYGETLDNSLYVHKVICECTTKDDSIVWVSMSVTNYKEFFDADAEFDYFFSAEFEKVYFADGIRIQGKVLDAEVENEGLSQKIGANTLLFFEAIIN